MANAKTTTTTTELTVTRNDAAAKDLIAAARSYNSALDKIKAAAILIGNDLPATGTTKEKVQAVMLAYAPEVSKLDSNGKNLFRSALYLVANPTVPVVTKKVATKGKGTNPKAASDITAPALEALPKISKHALNDAAKAIRESEGTANKPGAGNKAKTTAAGAKVTTASAADILPSFKVTLAGLLASEAGRKELAAMLKHEGFELVAIKTTGRPKAKTAGARKLAAVVSQQLAAAA